MQKHQKERACSAIFSKIAYIEHALTSIFQKFSFILRTAERACPTMAEKKLAKKTPFRVYDANTLRFPETALQPRAYGPVCGAFVLSQTGGAGRCGTRRPAGQIHTLGEAIL